MWGKLSFGVSLDRRFLSVPRLLGVLGLAAGLGCFGGSAANAQLYPEYHFLPPPFPDTVPRGETVRSRQRPEVDALGLHAGAFFFFPSVTNSLSYDDNVFATDGGETGDFLYTLSPNMLVRSDWNRHALKVYAGGNLGFYFDETDENFQDANAGVDGRFDIKSNSAVHGNLKIARLHESREDPNDVGGSEPTIFREFTARLQGTHRFNRLSLAVGNTFQYIDYDDTTRGGGLPDIDNDDSDRAVLRPGVQVGYEFHPGYQGFVRGEGKFLRYKNSTTSSGIEQNSKGFDLVAGANIDLTGLLFGEFFAGYRERHFDDSRFDTVRGPVLGSMLTWIPTGLTTVTLNVQNQIIEERRSTFGATSSSYTSTSINANVDHELLRNLILSGGAGFGLDDFESISREDKKVTANIGAQYLWNRYLSLGARYNFQYRNSNVSGDDFTRNLFKISLTAKL